MHIAWVTVSGWSRPTHQKTIQSQRFFSSTLSFLSSTLRKVQQEWDAAHLARGCRANQTRDLASSPSKNNTKSLFFFFSSTLTFFSSTLRHALQEWDVARIARGRLANPKRDLASYLTKTNKIYVCPANIDFLLVYAAKCERGVGRGAHRGRTHGQPLAGRPVLPVKNNTASTCLQKSWTLSSSTPRNA